MVVETVEVSVEKEMTHITGMNNICLSSASLINDTRREKLCQLSTRTAAWLLLTFFMCLRNQLNSLYAIIPADNNMFKVNKRNIRTRCEICLKLTIKTPLSLLLTLNIFHTLS